MTPAKGHNPRRGNPRGNRGKNAGGGRGGHNRRGPTPFPWDAEKFKPRITSNFKGIEAEVADSALDMVRPTSDGVRAWHAASLEGVPLAEPWVAGRYRGQGPPNSRLANCPVHVGGVFGTPPARVRGEVTAAFAELDRRLDALDARIANGESVEDVYEDVLAVCAWIHGQWVRIHPFVDHNGSTARLLTVAVGLRYGIPLQLPGKPRSQLPTDGLVVDYNLAAGNQMSGDDHLMKLFLHDLVEETLRQATTATAAEGSAIPVEGRFDSAADASAE
ncbi:hypothetical protein GCM10009623_15430 [Nocardioides aestuarii]